MYFSIFILSSIFSAASATTGSRVLELSDKFVETSKEGQWLVKFYAPWCAHCRRLEPVWAHVAQALYSTPVKVAKADCTRFSALGKHFKVSAYPTIMFIKDGITHIYQGERVKEDLVYYGNRMSQPPIQQVTRADSVRQLQETAPVFFGYVGDAHGTLWNMYVHHAMRYQPDCWFYSMSHDVARRDIPMMTREAAIFVYKDNEPSFFDHTNLIDDSDGMNKTLDKWINAERFGTFPKVTRVNIHRLMNTEKYLVLAVVAENKLMEITQEEKDFRDMIEGIIRKRKRDLHPYFQFGWVGSPDLSHSITMSVMPTPHLVVLNSTTSHHHLPEDDAREMTPEAVELFLQQIHTQVAPAYGGNSLVVRVYRTLFEGKNTLVEMWRGNPVLTALVLGLPLGFLSLICYSIFCADILDAEEEEQDSDEHEKKD